VSLRRQGGRGYTHVHDGDVVEDLCELGDVRHGLTVLANEGCDTNGGGQGEVGRGVLVGAELLEEGQEVGGVLVKDGVAADALLVGVFPAVARLACQMAMRGMDVLKVDTIKLVLVDHVQNRASKCGAVFWRGHCSGVVQ
jgi:hypothetical protein